MNAVVNTNFAVAVDIRHADCCEFLATLADESIDLVLTSPPYNIGSKAPRNDGRRQRGLFDPKSYGGIRGYDDNLPEGEYQSRQVKALILMTRKLKPDGVIAYNHKLRRRNKEIIDPKDWLRRVGKLVVADEIVWDRGSTHNCDSSMFWSTTERIYMLRKRDGAYRFRSHDGLKFRRDLWHIPLTNRHACGHPSPFPLLLARNVVAAMTAPGDLVCDPYSGSGTTAIAALESGRQFCGCDLKKEFVDQAIERVQAHLTGNPEPESKPKRRPPAHDDGDAAEPTPLLLP
jgi:modification methylase